MSNFSLSGSMLAHQPAVWGVSGLYEHDGTHRALSGELMCVHCYSYNGFGVASWYSLLNLNLSTTKLQNKTKQSKNRITEVTDKLTHDL